MAKPSSTNCPKAFRIVLICLRQWSKGLFWWLWSGCPPLPIPNREVKPRIADDTALVCGKVGRRQSFIRESRKSLPFFCLCFPCPRPPQPWQSACSTAVADCVVVMSVRLAKLDVCWDCYVIRCLIRLSTFVASNIATRVTDNPIPLA